MIGILVVIASVSPLMLLFFALVITMFVMSFRKLILLATELKRINVVAQAPLFSNISEVFNGASIVKSYGIQGKVVKDFEMNMDTYLHSNLQLELMETYS